MGKKRLSVGGARVRIAVTVAMELISAKKGDLQNVTVGSGAISAKR
jgi:hypothetical protein